MQGNEEGEMEEETEQSEQEEEIEQCEGSPLQNPLRKDELAKILANMGEYAQRLSPPDLHVEEEPKEHFAQDKNAPEELHDEEVEKESQPVHDESMTGEKSGIEEEQLVPSQTTPEEILEEEEAEKEVT